LVADGPAALVWATAQKAAAKSSGATADASARIIGFKIAESPGKGNEWRSHGGKRACRRRILAVVFLGSGCCGKRKVGLLCS
jgi:hypothetical protein